MRAKLVGEGEGVGRDLGVSGRGILWLTTMEENEQHKSGRFMSSGESRPPNPFAAEYRQCLSTDRGAAPSKRSLVRHPSLVSFRYKLFFIPHEKWVLHTFTVLMVLMM